ncbi:MAG: hypothetical protein ROO76_17860 [Terriglobia bacterium]|nr:hypothetical protein [Terriglobia bacterium]
MTDGARFLLGFLFFLFLIVIPVFSYLKLRHESNKHIVLWIFAIWFLWSAIHAPVHEGAHMLGGVLVGMPVQEYQLIQHFWRGDFVNGFVRFKDPSVPQLLVSCISAYVADFLIVLLAFLLFRLWRFSPFSGALILAVTFLRSTFDLAVNYTGDTVFGGNGDFRFLLSGYPRIAIHVGAWALMLLGAAGAMRELVRAHSNGRKIEEDMKVLPVGCK